jgi:hypothetical protein
VGTILQVVGFGWAIIGASQLIYGLVSSGLGGQTDQEAAVIGGVLGILINVLFFILPGLGIGGLGTMMKNKAANASKQRESEEDRIAAAVTRALEAERARNLGS